VSPALQLLVTLVGVTFLFGCLQDNGTIERVVGHGLHSTGGRSWLLIPLLFVLTVVTSAVGPGSILAVALISPFAMTAGRAIGVSPFVVSAMVSHGAMAGFLSPFSTTGAVAVALMDGAGLGGHAYRVWLFGMVAHTAMAGLVYAYALTTTPHLRRVQPAAPRTGDLSGIQWATVAVTGLWIAGIVSLRWPLGWSAAAAAAVLVIGRAAYPMNALRQMPWKVIVLVVGISSLVSLLERAGYVGWFNYGLTAVASPRSIHATVAFLAGVVSAYSSTSAVVLPVFVPLIPGIAANFPGVDPLALATSLLIGATLVDVSPMSTVGALCVAAAPPTEAAGLFRTLMAWGLAMTLVGATICHFASPLFGV